jgi:hypothetical protein
MKKIAFVLIALISFSAVFAQAKKDSASTTPKKTDWSKIDISRSGDHLMLQGSYDGWTNTPDSIRSLQHGFSRGFNAYVMLNKPFKSDPRLSAAFGIGISTSNIFFEHANVGITAQTIKLPFTNLDSANHFKKYKLTTAYLELPIELRFTANPVDEGKSWKAALGIKIGTLLSAHTKGKTLVNKNNITLNAYTEKESKKTFFNTTRLAATARIGYGHFSVFGAYTISSFLKDNAGPPIKPYQIGLTLSGL